MPTKNKPFDLWKRVDMSGDCWLWLGCNTNGYGQMMIDGKQNGTHRIAYELMYGPIPHGLMIRHTCDTHSCCNPAHLIAGTQIDNMQDMKDRGRQNKPYGQSHTNAKLTDAKVLSIRADGRSNIDIANDYGIAPYTVKKIKARGSWKHLP